MRIFRTKPLSFINNHLIDYPTPSNLSYLWSFGSLAGICLLIQIVTGTFLAMHYTPTTLLAFSSVEHIMRDVNFGWLLRYTHSNGASMFFIILYLHIAKGLYYGSYLQPRQLLWISGVFIFLLSMATAFLGYVLPFGQMSFWGATVITNFITVIPIVGDSIVYWLWGGFSVGDPTLNRFFSLHYILPFIISALALLHLYLLHLYGSGNPIGDTVKCDYLPFYPYSYVKDLYSLLVFFIPFAILVFFYPNTLGHSDNYIEANPMLTPLSIVPEWYFLPFYAILRSFASKLGGVCAMLGSILVWLLLPFQTSAIIRSGLFRPHFQVLYWSMIGTVILLGWLGSQPIEYPYTILSQFASIYYFSVFLILWPAAAYAERMAYGDVFK